MKSEEHERFAEVVSRGFDRGNFCNAYETQDYETGLEAAKGENVPGALRESFLAAFTLGFFGTYELDEMGSDVEAYQEAYFSPGGQQCVTAGYVDAREPSEWEEVDG